MTINATPEAASLRHRHAFDAVAASGDSVENAGLTAESPAKYIIAFDFGSTNIKACCFDTCRVQLVLATEIAYDYEAEPTVSGLNEINAEHLLTCFHRVLDAVFKTTAIDGIAGTLKPDDVECIAFTGQRNSFITWHAETGQPFHQFISWKNDKPERQYTRRWNQNYFLRLGRWLARGAHGVSGSQRMYVLSNFYFMSKQVLPRLKWCIDRVPALRAAMREGKARIGGIETWMTWRLSRGEKFIVDKTFACGTGLYQPVQMCWSSLLRFIFRIPSNMLPAVVDSCTPSELAFCYVKDRRWLLKAMCEDQQAAMFAALEYNLPQKITLGTGSFFNALVGPEPIYDQESGIYPLRACCLPNTDSRNWIAEASLPPLGEILDWAMKNGLSLDADFLPLEWRTAPYFDLKTRMFVEHESLKLNTHSSNEPILNSTNSREQLLTNSDAEFRPISRCKNDPGAVFLSLDELLSASRRSSILPDGDDDEIDDVRTMTNAQQKAANDRQRKSAQADVDEHKVLLLLSNKPDLEKQAVNPSTLRRHLLAWSVLEGCAFALYETLQKIQRRIPFDEKLGVDGGVSNNPLLLRSLSTLLNIPLVKCSCTNGSALGVALLAFFSREHDSFVDKMRDVNRKLNSRSNSTRRFDIFGLRQRLSTRRSLGGVADGDDCDMQQRRSAGTSPVRRNRKYLPQYSYDASEQFVVYEPDAKMTTDLRQRSDQWTQLFNSQQSSSGKKESFSAPSYPLKETKNVVHVERHHVR